MNRSSRKLVSVRPTVEALDSRELPAVSLSAFRGLGFQPFASRTRFIALTPSASTADSDTGGTNIIGILIALRPQKVF